MKTSSRSFFAIVIAFGGVALVGCDDGPVTGTDSGMTSMDSGMTTGDGGGGGDDGGGGTDGGGGGGDCASDANAYCARFLECDPVGFVAAFEDETICRRVVAATCDAPAVIPLSNGLTDEAACDAAQVADCDGFFSSRFPPIDAACVPLPGEVVVSEGACFTDLQCGMRDVGGTPRRTYCRPLSSGGSFLYGTAECPRGQCIASKSEGATCNPANQGTSEFCDRFAGQTCLLQFDADTGTTGTNQCRTVQYGGAGDPCFAGTERQCASGFECDAEAKTCMAALQADQACIPTRNLCDHRRALSCLDQGSGNVCVAPRFVGVGAQCGTVTVGGRTEMRMCSAYARCDTAASTPVCVALRALDETCTLSPDNCEPGLECDSTSNHCQVPEPSTTCP